MGVKLPTVYYSFIKAILGNFVKILYSKTLKIRTPVFPNTREFKLNFAYNGFKE